MSLIAKGSNQWKHGILFVFASAMANVVAGIVIGFVGIGMPIEFDAMPLNPTADYLARYNSAFFHMYIQNYSVYFAIMGGMLGVTVGWLGTVRNRLRASGASLVGGAITGALGGCMLGYITAHCLFQNLNSAIHFSGIQIEPIVFSTALHSLIWVFLGIGIGCGWTLSSLGFKKIGVGIQGGLAGGLLAGLTYSVVGAVVFSNSNAFEFVPLNLTERILWSLICGVCLSLGLFFVVVMRANEAQQLAAQQQATAPIKAV